MIVILSPLKSVDGDISTMKSSVLHLSNSKFPCLIKIECDMSTFNML